MGDIFISYRHNGGFPTANHLAEKLREDGYKVYFDKSSLKQGKFDEKILDQIEECTDFIVVLNKEAFVRTLSGEPREKDWLRRELAHAIEQKKNIIPIMLSGFEWPDHLPDDINEIRTYNSPEYSRAYFHEFYNNLTTFLKAKTPISIKKVQTPTSTKDKLKWIIPTLLLLGITAGCIWYAGLQHKKLEKTNAKLNILTEKEQEPILLLVGGGSVIGYIHDYINSTVKDKYVYVPLASSSAWPLIAEERSVGSIKEKHSYFPLLLSGQEATDSSFIKKETYRKDFLYQIGYVVEIMIGKSHLRVAISDTTQIHVPKCDSISSTELKQLLLNNCDIINVFTTTPETSATWYNYDNMLDHCLTGSRLTTRPFTQNNSRGDFSIEGKPFVILESLTYYAKNADVQKRVKVYDDDLSIESSYPLYIYFIAYKQGENEYVIPKAIRSFLSEIEIKGLPNDKTRELTPLDKESLIMVYDTLNHCLKHK